MTKIADKKSRETVPFPLTMPNLSLVTITLFISLHKASPTGLFFFLVHFPQQWWPVGTRQEPGGGGGGGGCIT
jgi:hypothetical protein